KAPISPYGAAKAAIEYYLFAYMHTFRLETLALRYGNVYGPRQDPRGEAGVISIFAEKLLANEVPTIFGTGKQLRDYIFVKEVARANLLATDCLLSGLPMSLTPDELALNIATGHSLSVNDLFTHLAKITDFSKGPFYGKARPGELMESRLDVTRAERKLGFTAETSFARGLAQVLAWLRKK
ncbi:MAG: NAD-dependent epimerase/dehydratase family protein, partial [Candidatus Bipolaricaulota bacterium]